MVAQAGAVYGQAPTLTALSPARNATAAPRTTSVAVTFSQSLSNSPGTQQAIKVFSQQAEGKKAGTGVVSGNTLTFAPTKAFRAGETVFATITSAAQSSSGQNLASPQVYQFTTATAPSTGIFYSTGQPFASSTGNTAYNVVPADVDADGDLDLVTSAGVRLNNGLGSFGEAQALPVSAATALTLGDVDSDGDLDLLAVGSGSSNTVSVRLNNGSGTFSGSQEVGVGSYCVAITLGDVDADGDLDLVTTNNLSADASTNGSVSVRLNNGSGTFGGGQEIATSPRPTTVLGDVDNDGDLDLVVATYGTGAVSVRRNNGLGSLGSGQELVGTAGAYQLLLGDVDRDGDLDLLSANAQPVPGTTFNTGQLYLYRNDGAGTLGAGEYLTGNDNPGYASLGDLDGDGDLDLLTTNAGFRLVSGGVRTLLNDGTGKFTAGVYTSNSGQFEYSIGSVIIDFDNDGDLDYLINNFGSLTAATNQGVPTIAALTPTAGPVGTTIIITGTNFLRTTSVTLNGVPLASFTVNSATQITVIVPLGATSGPLVVSTPVGNASAPFTVTPASSLAVTALLPVRNALAAPRATDVAATFNQPLGTGAATLGALKVFSQQAGGLKAGVATISGNTLRFNPSQDFKPGETVYASVTRAAQNSSGATLTVPQVFQFTTATTPSTAQFTTAPDLALTTPYYLALGDLDGDGDLDLVSAGADTRVLIRLNTGNGTFTNGQELTPATGNLRILLGDMDGDGDLDVVSQEGLRLNNGNATFGSLQQPQQPQPDTGGLALGDVDGDGDLDVLANGFSSFTNPNGSLSYNFYVRVKLNNGTGAISEVQQVPVGFASTQVVAGDVNNDGILDLLASSPTGGTVSVRLGTGFGTFATSGAELSVSTVDTSVLQLADADNDGDLDLFATNTGSTVTVLLNNGQGSFGNPRFVNLGSYSVFAAVGDVDGDGDLDLLAGGFPNSVSVRLNDGLGNFDGTQNITVGDSPRAIAVGDLDGNGTLDFITANTPSGAAGSASVRLNSQVLATVPAQLAGQVSLYPNPAHGTVRLHLPTELAGPGVQLQLLNALGQVVFQRRLSGQLTTEVPLPRLPAGTYTVQLSTTRGLVHKRLLVE